MKQISFFFPQQKSQTERVNALLLNCGVNSLDENFNELRHTTRKVFERGNVCVCVRVFPGENLSLPSNNYRTYSKMYRFFKKF